MQEQNKENTQLSSYQTGSTRPPKDRRGLVAVLLVAVVLLGGICSALGILNVRLFLQLEGEGSDPASLSFGRETRPSLPHTGTNPRPSIPNSGDLTVDIQDAPQGVENIPQEGGLSYQKIYEKAIPSVVSITCRTGTGTVSGSGVVLSADGYIVTNRHVLEGAEEITVTLTDGRKLSAAVVGGDALSDLAVLYVEAGDLTPAEFGDDRSLRVGDSVAAIGDPLGTDLRGTMTDGIVSAINRDVTVEGRTMTLIQTNAALNSGNSGGPLLNCYGQVIGINTLKISSFADTSGVEGLGFAIPSTTVKHIVDQLLQQGYVSGRPTLALTGSAVGIFEQRYYRLPAGILISEVEEGGCSADAGLAAGDIITGFDGKAVTDSASFSSALYACRVGQQVTLTVYRYRTAQQFTVTVILEEAR